MKRFTLGLLAAFCCLMGHATVSSVDDLVGVYSVAGTGTESVTNYSSPTDLSTKSYNATISKNDDGTITISNLLNFGSTLTGTVDLTAKTITIAPGTISWATFASASTSDGTGNVVADFTDEGVISVHDFGGWYYTTNYISTGATLTLTKTSIAEEWTVEGTIAYSNYTDDTNYTNYYTGTTTLTKYSGSDSYDYSLKCDGTYAVPSEILFKVVNGEITIANGYQYAGYSGAYFYYIYPDNNHVWLDTTEECTEFTGDKDGGSLTIPCYDYDTSNSVIHSGYLTFTWDTTSGISARPVAAKTTDDAPVYDLSGRRASSPSAGIYIQNGKKFVVK